MEGKSALGTAPLSARLVASAGSSSSTTADGSTNSSGLISRGAAHRGDGDGGGQPQYSARVSGLEEASSTYYRGPRDSKQGKSFRRPSSRVSSKGQRICFDPASPARPCRNAALAQPVAGTRKLTHERLLPTVTRRLTATANRQVIHVKKLRFSLFEASLYCLLFAAATVYIEARIKPQVLYHWNPVLFLKTFAFFRDIALLPGGITTYADKFLFQLNALPWLGALSTVSLAFLTGIFASRISSALTGARLSFFTVLPPFFVLCTLNQFRIIPLVKLLSALLVADVFLRLPARNAVLRVGVFLITSCFYLLVAHDLYWLFAALCVISEIPRREHRWHGAFYAILALLILSIDRRYFFYLLHTHLQSPSAALASSIERASFIEAALFTGLLLLTIAVAHRIRSLSALALLPILVIGYVDLQTWLSTSKALLFLLLGVPLLFALRAGRRKSKSIRWPAWTRPASITSLSLLGALTIGLAFNDYWSFVLRLNFYSATSQWSAVLREVQEPSFADASPILVSPFILEALDHMGKLPEDLFKYRQLYPPYAANVTPETLREDLEHGKYMVNLQQNARVCFDLGLINYAELTAFDVLEYRGDLLSSYQLIALVYLLKGNYEASRPFLAIIKQNLLSSVWADRYLPYADDPHRMEGDDYLMSIKSRTLLTDDPIDSLVRRPPFYEIAQRLVAHNPQNSMARGYLMSSYLLNGQLAKIYEAFFPKDASGAPLDASPIPRVSGEAILMYLEATGQEVSPVAARRIGRSTLQDFMEYSEILRRRAAGYPVGASAYPGRFDTSYLYYYTALLKQRPQWTYTIETAH